MKKIKKILLAVVVLIIGLLAGFIIFNYSKIQRVRHAMSLFEKATIVENMRTVTDWWESRPIRAAAQPHRFPEKQQFTMPESFETGKGEMDIDQYLDSTYTNGLIVLQHDSLALESYFRGHSGSQTQIVWSVSKSFLSAMFGIAIEEGHIKSIEQTVDEYCPELKGSGYEGVRIKDVLQMSSGIQFNEDYADFYSDINRWGRDFSWGNSQNEFAASLVRNKEPGTYHNYVSLDTHVLGMVLVAATGRDITDYAKEKLWDPLGMQHDSYWLVDGTGMEAALGGLVTTVGNCAKLGSLFLNKGNWYGKQVVPEAWVKASTTPDAPHLIPGERENSAHKLGYGYQWWIPEGDQGEFLAISVYNQFIYINPTSRTVIVKHSANPGFGTGDFLSSSFVFIEMCRAIVRANEVAPEGLSDEMSPGSEPASF